MSVPIIVAPSSANARAVSKPMPEAAPVIKTDFAANFLITTDAPFIFK